MLVYGNTPLFTLPQTTIKLSKTNNNNNRKPTTCNCIHDWLIYAVIRDFESGVEEDSSEVQLNVECLIHAFKKDSLHADYICSKMLWYSVARTQIDGVFSRVC